MKYSPARIMIALIGLIIIGMVLYGFLPKPVEVELATVTRGELLVTVDEDGKTRVKERYVISTPLAGRLQRVVLHAGDPVVAGQTVLASIEPNEPELLDPRALARAESLIQSREAFKALMIPLLERARTSLEFAEKAHVRVRKLFEQGAATPQDLDDAERDLRIAKEEVRVSQFAALIVTFELEQAKAALIRTRSSSRGEVESNRFEIRSPVSGVILRVFQESESTVPAGAQLLEVGNPALLECAIDVLSTDAVKIQPGARVVLEHWGGEAELSGRVRLVEPAGFNKVSALGVEEQRVNVLIDIDDPIDRRASLGDGFRIEARIIVWQGQDVLKVPMSALFRHGASWAVYVVSEGRARLRTLEIGHANRAEAEILSGLQEGERVIAHPRDSLADGVAVVSAKSVPER